MAFSSFYRFFPRILPANCAVYLDQSGGIRGFSADCTTSRSATFPGTETMKHLLRRWTSIFACFCLICIGMRLSAKSSPWIAVPGPRNWWACATAGHIWVMKISTTTIHGALSIPCPACVSSWTPKLRKRFVRCCGLPDMDHRLVPCLLPRLDRLHRRLRVATAMPEC